MLDGLKRLRLLLPLAALVGLAAPCLAADTNPHIVLQSSSEAESAVEAAAWTPDGKYVLTVNGFARALVIWEAATGRVIDRTLLPADADAWLNGMLQVQGISVSADGRTAMVRGTGVDVKFGDFPVERDYQVDLRTRIATVLPRGKALAASGGALGFAARQAALATIFERGTEMTLAAAEKALPRLPRSPDGKQGLKRTEEGLAIVGPGGRTLLNDNALGFADADLAPDGHMLVTVEQTKNDEGGGKVSTTVLRYDITAGRFLPDLDVPGVYGTVRWLDDARILVATGAASQDRDNEDADDSAPLSPSLVIDTASGKTVATLAGRCYIAPIVGGFVAADAGACRHGVKGGTTVLVSDGATWRPLKLADYAGKTINGIAASPDGKLAAIILVTGVNQSILVVVDVATGKTVDELSFGKDQKVAVIMSMAFTPDGKQLIVAANGGAVAWKFGEGQPREVMLTTSVPQLMATDGTTVLMSSVIDSRINRANLVTGAALPPIELANAVAGGFLPGKPIFWSASGVSGIRLWNTRNWQPILTLYPINGGDFVAVTPDGRYDTNLGPDASQFRWIVPDAPFQSLGPQTFMRDYFTPRLADKTVRCTVANDCAKVLPPLPSLASLNRVLPALKIVSVDETKPGYASVWVEARDVTQPDAANGKTRSGLYDVRLFRNGRFADHNPVETNEVLHQNLADWRRLNGFAGGADANGVSKFYFEVPLPTGAGQGKQLFTAYAFNEDRVKSDTAQFEFTAKPRTPRQPRAYIVTVGIDDYDDPRLKLDFSVADAHLLFERLAVIPGYEVHRLDLTSTPTRRVTREALGAAFGIMAGIGELPETKAALKDFDTSGMAQATPDDLVIISWSGHGWADPQGDFFLVPSDARWPADGKPDVGSLISAADLTMLLRDVRAGEIAFVIDACHSGASVDTAAFKPGPMGDPGLGQLAYDKGMRILAATQASDLAIEDARVGQGLLTYALAGEGVTATGGKADLNHDGRITLDEWLRYAVQRLPSLSADVTLGKLASARGFDRGPNAPVAKAQEPALFDFTGEPSPVVLRTGMK
ncbi:hypothetical protein SPAN111604_11205 [Sphingomonas antarctica]|uniref:hypothetical protein n=1 Tax=Sphingomonas antarctica TaxID=2040274 RepID=UPI0039EAA3D1